MTSKKTKAKAAAKPAKPKRDPSTIVIRTKTDSESEFDAAYAKTLTRPTVNAAATIYEYESCKDQGRDINAFVDELSAQVNAVNQGDLGRAEAMLITQAHTLDEMFNNLARRAHRNMGQYMSAAETYLRLALKAQSQCRATLETLATIKNPPIVYARQANIANGPQQVNNGIPSQARETEKPQNELLEAQHGERLDTAATGTASGVDPQLATVGASDRATDTHR